MNKLIAIIAVALSLITPSIVSAKDTEMRFLMEEDITGLFINSLNRFDEKLVYFIVDIKKKYTNVEMRYEDWIHTYTLDLTIQDRENILLSISKYKEWQEIAISNKVEVEKNINNFKISRIYWGTSNNFDKIMNKPEITLRIFSQNIERHQLVITSEKLKSEYFTDDLPIIYLEYDEVIKLEKILSEENISNSIVKEIEKTSKVDELFK